MVSKRGREFIKKGLKEKQQMKDSSANNEFIYDGGSFTKQTYHWYTKELYASEGINYESQFPLIRDHSIQKLLNLDNLAAESGRFKIPLISHRGFFFFEKNPKGLTESYCTSTVATLKRLSSENPDYKHYIWTNKPKLIPSFITNLNNVEVRLYNELLDKRLGKEMNILYTQAQITGEIGLLSQLSDILRTVVVREFGGIWLDWDSEILDASFFLKLQKSVSFFGGIEFSDQQYSAFGSAIFGATPNHPVQVMTSQLIERNINKYEDMSDCVKYPYSKFDKGLYYFGGPFTITTAIYKSLERMNGDYILTPPKVLFNFEYGWYISENSPCSSRLKSVPKLINKYMGIEFKTASFDPFCGSWADSNGYKNPIKYSNNENDIELVIARYNEDITPIFNKFKNTKITIYNKGEDNLPSLPEGVTVVKLPNIGREAHTYLYHVIANYDNLAKRVLFFQGDFKYHSPNFKVLVSGEAGTCKYIATKLDDGSECYTHSLGHLNNELQSFNWADTKWHDTRLSDESLLQFVQNNFNPSFTKETPISWLAAAQFSVVRENIVCHSIDFHKKLYDYFDHKSPVEGHYIERLWNEWANCDNQG